MWTAEEGAGLQLNPKVSAQIFDRQYFTLTFNSNFSWVPQQFSIEMYRLCRDLNINSDKDIIIIRIY